jgi:pimeloyl-ACP methyl ester carboxylesterase
VKLLLLHGALGASVDFETIIPHFPAHWEIHQLDFVNHGVGPFTDDPLSIAAFGGQVSEYLEINQLNDISIFGYSMGGYVACWLARREPERIKSIYTLGTKFIWSPESALAETAKLDPRTILSKVPDFAKALDNKHKTINWQLLLSQTAGLMTGLGNNPALSMEDYRKIPIPVMVARGELDKMVSAADQLSITEALAHGFSETLAQTPHPLQQVEPLLLVQRLQTFFEQK